MYACETSKTPGEIGRSEERKGANAADSIRPGREVGGKVNQERRNMDFITKSIRESERSAVRREI